jgi:CysZ protein
VLADFETGLRLLVDGGRFLRRAPALWPFAIVPVFLSLVLVAIAGTLFLAHLGEVAAFTQSLLPKVEATSGWRWLWVGPAMGLVWIAGGLAVVVAFGVAIVAAQLAANLVAAPFLERLSLRVEALASGGELDLSLAEVGVVRAAIRSIFAEARRVGLLALAWAGLARIGFAVPDARPWVAPVLVLVTVLFLPLEYAGHAFDRRGASLGARLRFVRSNAATMAGFGSVAFVACFLPGLNLLVMPALVTAGTLLVVRRDPRVEGGQSSDLARFSESET